MKWRHHQAIAVDGFFASKGLIDVFVSDQDMHTFVVLAERYDNPAASVTNNYENYAEQVCERFSLDRDHCVFLEIYRRPRQKDQRKEEITLDRVRLSSAQGASRHMLVPVDEGLRAPILGSLIAQCDVPYAYRPEESQMAACTCECYAEGQVDEECRFHSEQKWTLYDRDRNQVWGGEFDSEDAARRWRINAELPAAIVPMLVSEARSKEESFARPE